MNKLLLVLLLAFASAATGCAGFVPRAGMAPWDPPPSRSLLDQLPNWDTAAHRRCGAHLKPQSRTPEMTDRC
jgi:hypothetical protein